MYKQIVINVTEHETRVALLEDGDIAELFIERGDVPDVAGNIYKGRVQRVLPGMQAAFVDIGLRQAAFLYVNDVIGGNDFEFDGFITDRKEIDESLSEANVHGREPLLADRDWNIEELLSEGQEIMVHVAKAPLGTKGARVNRR
jgi:ribonuclease G